MVKSILINDNIHKMLVDKQRILTDAGMRTGISELAEKIIAANVEEYANKLLDNSKN